jgi:eukaryotic-like serine/threonine-protein kinase
MSDSMSTSSSPTPTELPPLQGRYRILDRLGASRLAVVYSAYDERLQRRVLVHLMRRELASQATLRARFLQEAEHHAARTHRSLLDVYDSGELAGRPFIVTEYVTGRALSDIGALSLEDALLYMRQIVGAVAVCQANNVPHPPISSANVILVDDGHVELLESWQIAPEDVARDLACYRPPERTAGAPVSPSGVVYSLGILFIELLIGKRPIDGQEPQQVAQAHLSSHIPAISDLQPRLYSPELEQLIQRAIARDPSMRLPDAAAFARVLDGLHTRLNGDTQSFRVPEQPSIGERVRHETGRLLQSPARRRTAAASAPPGIQPTSSVAPPRSRTALGLTILGVLFILTICAAYQLGSLAVERLADIRLPRFDVPSTNLGIALPDWLTGDVSGEGELFEITITGDEGLNLRDAPGLGSRVVTLLPNGTRVRRIDGPQIVDGVAWLKVRTRINDQDVEGWVSANYVRQV